VVSGLCSEGWRQLAAEWIYCDTCGMIDGSVKQVYTRSVSGYPGCDMDYDDDDY